MDSYHFIHGSTKLPATLNGHCLEMTMVSYGAFIVIGAWPVAGLSSRILGGNKDSLTIASIFLYTSRSRCITTATADPPYAKQ